LKREREELEDGKQLKGKKKAKGQVSRNKKKKNPMKRYSEERTQQRSKYFRGSHRIHNSQRGGECEIMKKKKEQQNIY